MRITPCLILLIGIKGFTLQIKKVEVSQTCLVICKCNIIMLSRLSSHRCWSPQVTVDFPTKLCSTFSLPSLCNRLLCHLRIHTGLAEERITCWRGFQSHARHEAFVNKLPHYLQGD